MNPTYFAQIDNNNLVINVIVADQSFVSSLPGTWIQTDINGISPLNYAGIGYTWNPGLNGFIAPQPFASWFLDNSTCLWNPPVAMPTDGQRYYWDEASLSWKILVL